ncbi:MAG: hypothetical protein II715_03990 [Clostridia bacterium]|nr:hypothetical protein [Clostridia bacterium]
MAAGRIIRKLLFEKGPSGAGPMAKDNMSGLESFSFNFDGTIGGNNYTYVLNRVEGKWIFQFEGMAYSHYGTLSREVDPSVPERLYRVYLDQRIACWDGYQKYDPNVCDGSGFSVYYRFGDGKSVSASGMNAFPDGYADFTAAVEEIFSPVREEMLEDARQSKIREGIDGRLHSYYACFKQRGSSGSDSYQVCVYRWEDGRSGFEVSASSESGTYFGPGKYDLRMPIPDGFDPFSGIRKLIDRYEIIRWYDFEGRHPDYDNQEWFQVDFFFDSGKQIRAMGTEHPENYDEFRDAFLKTVFSLAEQIRSFEQK